MKSNPNHSFNQKHRKARARKQGVEENNENKTSPSVVGLWLIIFLVFFGISMALFCNEMRAGIQPRPICYHFLHTVEGGWVRASLESLL